MRATGEITACYQNIRTGRITPVLRQKNLILFEGADIMAGLLAGNPLLVPSYMYLQYHNTSGTVLTPPAITRGDGRSYFNSITGTSPKQDWLRIPIITTPKVLVTPDDSSDYQGNGVIFTGSSAASQTLLGESPAHNYYAASGANGPSNVFALALAAAPVPQNGALDKLFSRINLTTPLAMQPGSHLTFYWAISFN